MGCLNPLIGLGLLGLVLAEDLAEPAPALLAFNGLVGGCLPDWVAAPSAMQTADFSGGRPSKKDLGQNLGAVIGRQRTQSDRLGSTNG